MRVRAVFLPSQSRKAILSPLTITTANLARTPCRHGVAAAGSDARPTARTRSSSGMGMALSWVPEDAVKKAVAAAAKVCLLSPRESWSADFLIEYIISELSLTSSQGALPAATTTTTSSEAVDDHADPTQAAAAPAGTTDTLLPLTSTAVAAVVGKAPGDETDASGSTPPRSGGGPAAAASQLSDIIVGYYEAEPGDVSDFQEDLSRRLQQLVAHHAAAGGTDSEEELGEGACRLCGRNMPLTKHHLVPKEVHKEFRKRGWTREQLSEGVAVCRPCHSAIHKAVPDNKELGVAYHSLEALQQHESIAKFAAWAAKQRTPSAADVRHNPNFRYQR